ncbi:unnamed protein product [Colias eurytheme]|nr:unnamed protein product [Colias eurytheme]
MRTSTTQFELMVSYMERHGDLSRPSNGPHGRVTNINRWAELVTQLNADATGDTKNEEKWRKTWSDLKNNTKRKAARLNKAMSGTGGGPALKIKLSGIEERVLAIINPQAASGMTEVLEVFVTENDGEDPGSSPLIQVNERENEDWNVPGSSSQPPIFEPANLPPPPPATPPTPIQRQS